MVRDLRQQVLQPSQRRSDVGGVGSIPGRSQKVRGGLTGHAETRWPHPDHCTEAAAIARRAALSVLWEPRTGPPSPPVAINTQQSREQRRDVGTELHALRVAAKAHRCCGSTPRGAQRLQHGSSRSHPSALAPVRRPKATHPSNQSSSRSRTRRRDLRHPQQGLPALHWLATI